VTDACAYNRTRYQHTEKRTQVNETFTRHELNTINQWHNMTQG